MIQGLALLFLPIGMILVLWLEMFDGLDHGSALTVVACGISLLLGIMLCFTRVDEMKLRVEYIGRFAPEKGASLFARAASRLSIPAIFIGKGQCEAEIREICPHAEFPGWLSHEEMEKYFSRARAFVFPSKWYEGQPLTPLEALARGIPVITADACAARDEILDGETGLLFENGSLDSLCEKIELLKDDTLLSRLSVNAHRAYWQRGYGERVYVHRLEEIYRNTLSEISGR